MTEALGKSGAAWLAEGSTRILCGQPIKGCTQAFFDYRNNTHRLYHFLSSVNIGDRTVGDELHQYRPLVSPDIATEPKIDLVYGEYVQLFSELMQTRAVDYFLTYVSRLLTAVLSKYPESLQSVVEVKLADVLRLPDKDAVVRHAVDGYVRRLSYQGIRELHKDVKSKFGFSLFVNDRNLALASEMIAIRNLIVHNDAVVDIEFKRRSPGGPEKPGDRLTRVYPLVALYFFVAAAFSIDLRAQKKWDLAEGDPTSGRLYLIFADDLPLHDGAPEDHPAES